LPETITAVLDLRLARLSPACRRVLGKAAVLGGSFEFSTLCFMDANTPDSNEDVVLELIEEALETGMLTEEGIGTRITYQFWHPLLVSHLYESLSAARRANLHRRAAEILLKLNAHREEEAAATLSYHLLEGGADSDQIAYYSELAGNRAYALSAYPEAEKHYRLTLEHLGNSFDEQLHRASLLELLGECTSIQGKYEEARHFYEQAFDVRRQQNDSTDTQQEVQIQALLLYEIARALYDVGDNAQSRLYCRRSEQVLRDANIVSGPAWAKLRHNQSCISWREGSYEEASRLAHEALELFHKASEQRELATEYTTRPTRLKRTLAGDLIDLGRIQMLLGLIANGAGRSNDALTHFTEALTIFEQHDYQREIAILCCNLGDLYLRKAEYPQAQAVLRRSLSIAERIGDIPVMSFAIGNLGIANLRIGNLVDAERELRRGILFSERVNDPLSVSMQYSYLGAVLQEQGKLFDAQTLLSRALIIGRVMHVTPYIGLTLVAVGNLRVSQVLADDFNENSVGPKEKSHFVSRAKKTLQHALSYEGIEAETRIEGELAQSQVLLLNKELDEAYQAVLQTLQEAQQSGLTWLVGRIQCLLACILVAKEEWEQAIHHFEQALRIFRKHDMRLEHGRTLEQYGLLLLRQGSGNDKSYQRGLNFLQEARQLFTKCHAQLDLRSVERLLVKYDASVSSS
jgi:tetratricopeptide (TPR) repeat protein